MHLTLQGNRSNIQNTAIEVTFYKNYHKMSKYIGFNFQIIFDKSKQDRSKIM